MTVVNPKSISGINSITTGSGSDDILTIHTNNGTERLRIDSTGATKIVTGIVTTLTATTGIVTTLTSNTTTLNSTTTATGNVNVSGANITLQDSGGSSDDRLVFGAGSDLSIYHDGSNSYIEDSGTGKLNILSSQAQILNPAANEAMAKFIENGAVELYNDNTKRFETTSGGVEVFGELQMDDANSHIKLIDGARIDIGTGGDLRIYHSSTQNFIRGNATASPLYIDCCENVHIRHLDTDGSNAETMIKAIGDGNVELYSNNVKRFQTRSGGGAADGIAVYGSSSNTAVNLFTDSTVRGTVYANSSNQVGFLDEGGDWAIKHTNNTSTEFYVSTQLRAMIDSDGLKFHGDTATANALDDYEEGTFTPNFDAGGGVTFSYNHQYGFYTKIGDTVTFQLYIMGYASTITGGNEGNGVVIQGLPYTILNHARYYPAFTIGRTYKIQLDADKRLYSYGDSNSTNIRLIQEENDTAGSVLTAVQLNQNPCLMQVGGVYRV